MQATASKRGLAAIMSAGAVLALGACANQGGDKTQEMSAGSGADAGAKQMAEAGAPDLVTKQDSGKVTYWVMPGPRELSPAVFGTPANPKMRLKPKVREAHGMVAAGKAPPSVPKLLKDLPILVGVPDKARSTMADGTQVLKQPTPFSDDGLIISGNFEAKFWDEVNRDTPGKPGDTPDKAEMTAEFTDPQGNDYKVVLDHVVKPPFPGYETDGGVLLNGYHHGSTGTGTPLMPQVWTIGAFWGVGEVHVNGELRSKKRVMHLMTTETVRDNDYHLALQEEMPLAPGEWLVKDQPHHTHLIVLPIQATKQGPKFKPLKTAFNLGDGKTQPFMHIMFEQDTVVK
jgi:hypothetical protein